MFCPKCGKELPDDYKACPSCGFSFENFNTPNPESKEQDVKHVRVYHENSGCLTEIAKSIFFIIVFSKIVVYLYESPAEKIYEGIFCFIIFAALGVVLYYFVIGKLIDKYWPD